MAVESQDIQPQKSDGVVTDDLVFIMIANAKKIGLSLMELNEFTVSDFIKLVNVYVGEDRPKARPATQEDIDRLLS